MATALKSPPAGLTGAVRSLQWTIQDLNGSVEHLGQSHDQLRRAQNLMAWTTAIFGALLLSGLVWIANDVFHLKDQLMDSNRRFDALDAQMSALGSRIDDLNVTIEQIGAEIVASRGAGALAGPEVSVLSTPTAPEGLPATETTGAVTAEAGTAVAAVDAAAQPAAPAPATEAPATEAPVAAAVIPPPPAPRDQLTPEELATPAPVIAAAAPAAQAPAPAAEAAAPAVVAEAAGQQQPAAAAAPAAAPAGDLSDDQLLSYNDDQIDPADELLLLDENGNPQ